MPRLCRCWDMERGLPLGSEDSCKRSHTGAVRARIGAGVADARRKSSSPAYLEFELLANAIMAEVDHRVNKSQ